MTGGTTALNIQFYLGQEYLTSDDKGYFDAQRGEDMKEGNDKRRLDPNLIINDLNIAPFIYKFGKQEDVNKSTGVDTAQGVFLFFWNVN